MVTLERHCRPFESAEQDSGPIGLGDFSRSIQPSEEAVRCANRFRSICISLQLQGNTLLHEDENSKRRDSLCILPTLEGANSQLVLCPFQFNRSSDSTLYRVQSTNGTIVHPNMVYFLSNGV